MLREIRIENLAIIEHLEVVFPPGLVAITGETGAGKSILINALKLVLGEKAKTSLLRRGADKLRVEAVFALPPSRDLERLLDRLGIDREGGELVLEREIKADGKQRARANGAMVTLSGLQEIGEHLVDLHGQHQQQSLFRPATHLSFIDRFGGMQALVDEFAGVQARWREHLESLRKFEAEAAAVKEQRDFFAFQYKELEEARFRPGEEEELEEKLKVLSSLGKIAGRLRGGIEVLGGDRGLLAGLAQLRRQLPDLEASAAAFAGLGAEAHNAEVVLQEILRRLETWQLPEEADPAALDGMNSRLAGLQRLKAKYQTDLPGLIALRDSRKEALDRLSNYTDDRDRILAEVRSLFADLLKKAAVLTKKREAAALRFEKVVRERLAHLGMKECRFSCRFERLTPVETVPESLPAHGADRMEFLLAANPGEAEGSLSRIASGGEVSRVMLAMKSVLTEADPVPLLVFDEIDTGIDGTTANRVGEVLKELAGAHQVIVITHFPQVAAGAGAQFRVAKKVDGGRTQTSVEALAGRERVEELARMIGDGQSEAARKHARELLQRPAAPA